MTNDIFKIYLFTINLLFYLSSTLGFTQETTRVIYKVEFDSHRENNDSAQAEEYLVFISEAVQSFEFELLIGASGKSIFRKTEPMIEDYNQIYLQRLALGFSGGDEVWYTEKDKSKKLIYKIDLDGSVLLTFDEVVKWEIGKDRKQIEGYDAVKATAVRKRGDYVNEIEVWFTPEISCPFGPLGYNGLPGLILEMKRGNVVYRFKKLENNAITIESPKESNQMPLKDYYEKLESRIAEIKGRG